jgi:dTDP-N-acetylfucosamine:lipid II N-acetylfucosaminyltransferase
MILHLVPDEKFIDASKDLFEEVAPGLHRYVLLGDASQKTKYIRTFEPERSSPADLFATPAYRTGLQAVFVHFLDREARVALAKAPRDVPVVWFGWGRDYYHLICARHNLFGPRTLDFLHRSQLHQSRLSRSEQLLMVVERMAGRTAATAGNRLHQYWQQMRDPIVSDRRLLSRVQYFVPIISDDWDLIEARQPWFKPEVIQWNYPCLEEVIEHVERDGGAAGDNVLLGNSATAENNHLDLLPELRPLMQNGGKMFCPLSYGDAAYGDMVASEGERLYGSQFIAIREFMPLIDYLAILRSCSTVVMPHLRQQAMGNIFMMLYAGADVVMDSRNPAYRFLRRLGLPISELSELRTPHRKVPTSGQLSSVRRILRDNFGRAACLKRTASLLRRVGAMNVGENWRASA